MSDRGREVEVHRARLRVARLILATIVVRGTEVLLVVLGLWFALDGSDREEQVALLFLFDFVALVYLAIGALVIRRAALRSDTESAALDPTIVTEVQRSRWMSRLTATGLFVEQRFAFLLTAFASFTGLLAAVVVMSNREATDIGQAYEVFGVTAILLSWALLNGGYGRYYLRLYRRPPPRGGGFEFPDCPHPGPVEFTYLAFTVGVSFAVSDVTITKRSLRWRLMVHGVIAFMYNAAVLAVAVSAVSS